MRRGGGGGGGSLNTTIKYDDDNNGDRGGGGGVAHGINIVGRAAGAETGRFIGGHGAGRGEVVINDRVNGAVRCFGLRL